MLKIIHAKSCHGPSIAKFQVNMALETEHLQLDKQLVHDAVHYLIDHKQYGQYFVPVREGSQQNACGSLLITYENQQSWWIQSVYVVEESRRKGVFTSMFKTVLEEGKQRGVKSVQLYVQKQNDRAMQTYKKLGMYVNGNEFFGFQLVYGSNQIKNYLTTPVQNHHLISPQPQPQPHPIPHPTLPPISGTLNPKNNLLVLQTTNKQTIGICQYFKQFSDWRYGIIIYINYIAILPKYEEDVLIDFIRYLYQNSQLKVGAIRIICKEGEINMLEKIVPKMHRDVYYVMRIDI